MPVDAFQVDCMFKGEQYQSHALFSEGRNKKGYIQGCDWDKVVEIGKLLAAGYKDREIGRKVNCDAERVSKIRKKINLLRGTPFLCRCGRIGGHNNAPGCNHIHNKLPDGERRRVQ